MQVDISSPCSNQLFKSIHQSMGATWYQFLFLPVTLTLLYLATQPQLVYNKNCKYVLHGPQSKSVWHSQPPALIKPIIAQYHNVNEGQWNSVDCSIDTIRQATWWGSKKPKYTVATAWIFWGRNFHRFINNLKNFNLKIFAFHYNYILWFCNLRNI